jgi:hypothetical protein
MITGSSNNKSRIPNPQTHTVKLISVIGKKMLAL